MRITNVSPYGALDVPLLRRTVDAGETVDVSDEHGAMLLEQHENYAPADDDAKTVRDDIDKRLAAVERVAEQEGPPAKSATKPEWVAYAVTRGADPDEAGAMTQKELIKKFGA